MDTSHNATLRDTTMSAPRAMAADTRKSVILALNSAALLEVRALIWKPLDNSETLRKKLKGNDLHELFDLTLPPDAASVRLHESRIEEIEWPIGSLMTEICEQRSAELGICVRKRVRRRIKPRI